MLKMMRLVQVYLERQGGLQDKSQKGSAPNSSNWEAVARLLSRKHDRIDPQHALDLLPGLVWHTHKMPLFCHFEEGYRTFPSPRLAAEWCNLHARKLSDCWSCMRV